MSLEKRAPITWTVALVICCLAGPLRGADPKPVNAVTPGEFIVDPPTLINLGFEWMIAGDDNRNAAVEVSYRKKGDSQWKHALPLLRLQNEEIYQGDRM